MYIIEIVTLSPIRMYISLSPRPTNPIMDNIWYQTWFYHIIILKVLHVLKMNWFGKESKYSTATSSWTMIVVDQT